MKLVKFTDEKHKEDIVPAKVAQPWHLAKKNSINLEIRRREEEEEEEEDSLVL